MLAAGRGRRFAAAGGRPFKQGAPFDRSHSLVEHVCVLYAGCRLSVVCALHPELSALGTRLADSGYHVVPVAQADVGMGHSLATAVTAAPSASGWLIALADMPAIRPATIDTLADALIGGAALCAPFHGGRRGHPVGFSAEFGAALRTLDGDAGARSIVQANIERLQRIDVDDPGVLVDIDRPDQLPVPDVP